MQHEKGLYANITLNDLQLAEAYYPILVDLAKQKALITYGELVDRAKDTYPDKPEVQNAIPVSTGRRLDVVRLFTSGKNLPDLTSLVVNQGTGECGSFYTEHFDPVAARKAVFDFDWSTISTEFAGYIKHTKTAITPRKRISEAKALDMMAQFYRQNKDKLPENVREKRELIVELLVDGFSEEDAFSQALK